MGRLGLILITVAATAMAFTNPNQQTHRQALYAALATEHGASQSVGQWAGSMLGDLDPVPYQYHNYLLFSTMTLKDKTVSVGAVNRIWSSQ